jgi:hypothetical protein
MGKCWHHSMVIRAIVNGQYSHMYRLHEGQFHAECTKPLLDIVLQTYYCYYYDELLC